MDEHLQEFLKKKLDENRDTQRPPEGPKPSLLATHHSSILLFVFGLCVLASIVIYVFTSQPEERPRSLTGNEYEERVLDIGPSALSIDVPPNTCIHGGKNFEKVEVVSRDGDQKNLHQFTVRSKDSATYQVTFVLYPISHDECTSAR